MYAQSRKIGKPNIFFLNWELWKSGWSYNYGSDTHTYK